MLKSNFRNMFKLASHELITRFKRLCLSIVLMVTIFLGNPFCAQVVAAASNHDTATLSVTATGNGAIFSVLIADAAGEPEAAVKTPEAGAKAEAKKAKAAAKLEAKKLKEAEEAKEEEAKAVEKAAKKAAKLAAKKAKEAAKLEAKRAKEAKKAAKAVEEKEKPVSESFPAPETSTDPAVESTPTEVVTP